MRNVTATEVLIRELVFRIDCQQEGILIKRLFDEVISHKNKFPAEPLKSELRHESLINKALVYINKTIAANKEVDRGA